jgi:hypothetical protein
MNKKAIVNAWIKELEKRLGDSYVVTLVIKKKNNKEMIIKK